MTRAGGATRTGGATRADGPARPGSATRTGSATRVGRPPLAPAGRAFAIAAFLEAFTWVGLLIGMYVKYVPETTDRIVSVFGALHGGMFLIYLVVTAAAAITLRWRWWETALALLAAIPPLVTIVVEIWFRRRGTLAAPADRPAPRT